MHVPARDRTHRVGFYDGHVELVSTVVDYLFVGLRAGQPAVVIATSEHATEFVIGLQRRGIDVEGKAAQRDFILLDARQTLSAVLRGRMPDRELFDATVGNILEAVERRRPGTVARAYGEMVDILCRDGNAKGAIALEKLWNEMMRKHPFSLLCAYSDGRSLQANRGLVDEICAQHHDPTGASTGRIA